MKYLRDFIAYTCGFVLLLGDSAAAKSRASR